MRPYSQVSEWEAKASIIDDGIKKDWYVKTYEYDDVIKIPNTPEAEANAKLIAAAPDLLEALQALLKSFDEIIPTPEELGTSVPTALLKAQAAIKKATN